MEGWIRFKGWSSQTNVAWSSRGPPWNTPYVYHGKKLHTCEREWQHGMLCSSRKTDCWRYVKKFSLSVIEMFYIKETHKFPCIIVLICFCFIWFCYLQKRRKKLKCFWKTIFKGYFTIPIQVHMEHFLYSTESWDLSAPAL